ncbi:MAG: recombinase family protein [Solirubrobacteraceae bacterium]
MPVLDAYIRVSRVGGRSGDSYRSPDQQRAAMERWAEAHGVAIGKVVVDEDVSGKKRVKERGLEQLIARAEAGVSDGVIAWRLNRFGRNMKETVVAVDRLKTAGARLVAVDEGYDSSEPGGQIKLGVFAALAEQQLEERTTNWKVSTSEAVADGIHVACRAPVGYLRRDQVEPKYDSRKRLIRDGRLVLDPPVAKAVHRAFEMRARGESLQTIAHFLRDALDRKLAKSSVSAILKNRAYLGEARGPHGAVNRKAHEPIVTPELFAAAQREGAYSPRDGSLASQSALAGIITCASCGRNLMIMGRSDPKTGGRKAAYVCTAKYDGNDCDEPAIGDVAKVDGYVLWLLQESEQQVIASVRSAEMEYLEAREALRLAEGELTRYVDDATLATELGQETWRRGMTVRAEAVEKARAKLWDLDDPGLPEDAKIVTLDGKPHLYTLWGDDPAADRRTLRKCIGGVTLKKCDRRRGWQPIEERVSLRWADGSEPQIPSVAELVSSAR